MRPLIYQPNPLAFPSRAPGVNPSHPAANGKIYLAGIALNGNFVNLLNGAKGTINGTPSAGIYGAVGPVFVPAATNNGGSASTAFGIATPAGSVCTFSAIFMTGIITGGSNSVVFYTGNQGFQITNSTGALVVHTGGGGTVTLSPTLQVTAHTPYFFAGSYTGDASGNFVLVNLATGSINTATGTTGYNVVAGTTIVVGNAVANNSCFGGGIATVSYAINAVNNVLSIPALVQLAARPWDFWYPL